MALSGLEKTRHSGDFRSSGSSASSTGPSFLFWIAAQTLVAVLGEFLQLADQPERLEHFGAGHLLQDDPVLLTSRPRSSEACGTDSGE
ncbi:MAG: hypothetical protein WKF75_04595 [Singulisphaera sp.]